MAERHAPSAEGLGSTLVGELDQTCSQLRVHIPQLKVPHTTTKVEDPTCHNEDLGKAE